MKATQTQLLKFFRTRMQLSIPIYQRTYSWKLKECKQLWKDILASGKDDSTHDYFIGSIVYVTSETYQAAGLPNLLVIDGQQRLTTLSLIIIALSRYIKENKISAEITSEKLDNYYLLNTEEEGERRYKLILTRADKETLRKLIKDINLTDEDSMRIRENYEFFNEQIKQTDFNIVYKGLEKLSIIDVTLDRERDKPQLIFESLNSTGLELTQADLIRNYILMGLEADEQRDLYTNFWYPIERNFGHSEKSVIFDRFIRDFLTVKIGRIPTIREIYSEFKQYSKNKDIKKLIEEIYTYSRYYSNFALEKESDKGIKKVFCDINELRVDVSYPFILNLYRDYVEEKLSRKDFIEILRLIESYVFRRAICGVPTNSLNKTFAGLYKTINKDKHLESLKAVLMLHVSYRRMPNDEEFKKDLKLKDVYNFRSRNYLLKKLENYKRKETVTVDSYTIEHILPQNPDLSMEWQEALGEDWKEIQVKYLHTIGNLTLTGYNSELSDNPFNKKRDMDGGFRNSPIRLNKSLASLTTWNEEELKKRAVKISKLAEEIWPYPVIDSTILEKYKSEKQKMIKHIYTINDHTELNLNAPMRPLFDKLRKRILNIDPSVKEEFLKQYVAYKSTTNFVDIIPQKKALCLSLNIDFEKVKDNQGKCRDVSDIGRWGNGKTEVKIENEEELQYSMGLILQAFENITEV